MIMHKCPLGDSTNGVVVEPGGQPDLDFTIYQENQTLVANVQYGTASLQDVHSK